MIGNTVFADTSALYALFAPSDSLKSVAQDILDDLINNYKANIVTTQWVVYETLSKLKKHGHSNCKDFKDFTDEEYFIIVGVDEDLEYEGVRTFWAFRDKSWGIIDCTSINYMWNNSISFVFGKDIHFSQASLSPLIDQHSNKAYQSLTFPNQ